jgi:hypothetical protein
MNELTASQLRWSAGSATMENNFDADVAQVFKEAEVLLLRKHADYGPKNIAQAPGGPLNGLAVRLHDKVARLGHLLANGAQPNNESLRDTMLDVCNYGAIGVLVIDGKWPGVDKQ